jgi:hypothetical protein
MLVECLQPVHWKAVDKVEDKKNIYIASIHLLKVVMEAVFRMTKNVYCITN